MKPLRFLLAPVFALFDFKLYREVRALRASSAVLYVAYLSGLFALFFLVAGILSFPKVDAFAGWVRGNFAAMTISNEGMRLDTPGRYELKHPEWGAIAVFDDTVERINPEQMGPYLIYMTSKMVYVKRDGKVQSNLIGGKAQKDFKARVDGASLYKVYQRLKVPVFVFILILVLVIGIMGRLIMTLFLALVALAVQLAMPRGLRFENLFVLASFASSVGLVFSLLQMIPALAPFFSGPVGGLLSLVYLIIAIAVQPKLTQTNV